jgi:hypothetical protein
LPRGPVLRTTIHSLTRFSWLVLVLAACGDREHAGACPSGADDDGACVAEKEDTCDCREGRPGKATRDHYGGLARCNCIDFPAGSLVAMEGLVPREGRLLLDFGAVPYAETRMRTFTVKNVSAWPMQVVASASDPRFGLDHAELQIEAGREASIDVRFAATGRGEDDASLSLAYDGDALTVELHARVAVPSFQCSPDALEFGWLDVGTEAELRIDCLNSSAVPAHEVRVSAEAPFTAELDRAEVAPSDPLTITVRYHPLAPASWDFGDVTLHDGPYSDVTFQVKGRARQEGSGPQPRSCDPVPIEKAWEAKARGGLDWEVRCGWITPERAQEVLAAGRLEIPDVAEDLPLVESGEQTYDPVRWGCCIESLSRLPCWIEPSELDDAGCDRPFLGARGPGEPCSDFWSCRGGFCPYNVCNPTCEASEFADLGEPCGDGFRRCWKEHGWACRQGRCAERAGPGEECERTRLFEVSACEPGYECDAGTCAPSPTAGTGEPCVSEFEADLYGQPAAPRCRDGWCDHIQYGTPGMGICEPWPVAGEPCLDLDVYGGLCPPSLLCTDGVCAERLPEGSPCVDTSIWTDPCTFYAWCQPTTGTCGPDPLLGEPCVDRCDDGWCDDGACAPIPSGLGEPCTDDGPCDMDKVCVDGACTWACGAGRR